MQTLNGQLQWPVLFIW